MNEPELRKRFFAAQSEKELERMFRILSKHTHPDLTGKSGDDFTLLHSIYTEARDSLTQRQFVESEGELENQPGPAKPSPTTSTEVPSDFDPWQVLEELGLNRGLSPRAAHYAALYRFHSAGLGNSRIRKQEGLQKRNALIIRTVEYWAGQHDAAFVPIFQDFVAGTSDGLMPTSFLKAAQESRRLLEEGFSHFYRFQAEGRKISRTLALRNLESAVDTLDVYRLEGYPAKAYANWLITQLQAEPAF